MTSYRTGQVVGYGRSGDGVRTEPRPRRQEDELSAGDQLDPGVNELPSVALTTKFLELCQQHGFEQLAVRIVAAGRSTGVPGLPQGNDWTAWNADQMRAAIEHLQHKLGGDAGGAIPSASDRGLARRQLPSAKCRPLSTPCTP